MIKTLHYTLLSLVVLIFSNTIAQDIKGTWISTHNMELRSVQERETIEDNEFATTELASNEVDTFYNDVYILLDFIDDKKVIVKALGAGQEMVNYTVRNNKLKIKVKKYKIHGWISKNSVVIMEKVSKSKNNETYFVRLNDSKINDKTGIDSISFINTNWVVNTDTSSHNYGYNFHFLDSATAIINQDFGDYGYTNWGKWKIDWYKKHLFIGVSDMNLLETKVYHFFDKKGNTLIGNTYEHYTFAKEPPPLKNIELIRKEFPESKQLKSLKEKLFGRWIAINNPLSIDSAFQYLGNVESVLNQKFEINFDEDKTFQLEKSGTIVTPTNKSPQLISITGNWEMGRTGKYIILKPNNKWTKYLTINTLEEDYLEIFCEMEAIYDKNTISNKTVKMVKISGTKTLE